MFPAGGDPPRWGAWKQAWPFPRVLARSPHPSAVGCVQKLPGQDRCQMLANPSCLDFFPSFSSCKTELRGLERGGDQAGGQPPGSLSSPQQWPVVNSHTESGRPPLLGRRLVSQEAGQREGEVYPTSADPVQPLPPLDPHPSCSCAGPSLLHPGRENSGRGGEGCSANPGWRVSQKPLPPCPLGCPSSLRDSAPWQLG